MRPPRRAFTLLEILIVGVLTSVLMLGLWSLFRTWGRLYERGQRRVAAAQLVRSLSDQFADDVRSVAHVPPLRYPRRGSRGGSSGSSSSSSGSSQQAPTFGGNQALIGGATWLVLEVLQPPSPHLYSWEQDDSVTRGGEEDRAMLMAPELQRVLYTFETPQSEELGSLSAAVMEAAEEDDTEWVAGEEDEDAEPLSGLLRMVVPWEQFEQLTSGGSEEMDFGATLPSSSSLPESGRGSSSSGSGGMRDVAWSLRDYVLGTDESTRSASLLTSSSSGDSSESDALPLGIVQDVVPEVIWLEFRYFDGSSWTSSWDSRSAGRLPVAVEMRFELLQEESEEKQAAMRGDEETELVDDGLSESGASELPEMSDDGGGMFGSGLDDMTDDSLEETPYYRCLIYLQPGAEESAGGRAAGSSALGDRQ